MARSLTKPPATLGAEVARSETSFRQRPAAVARPRLDRNLNRVQSPAINIYSHEVIRHVRFYEGLGFRETFRTPKEGTPVHVEVVLDGFTIGIAAVEAAIADHGLNPNLGGRPVEIVLWTDDVNRD